MNRDGGFGLKLTVLSVFSSCEGVDDGLDVGQLIHLHSVRVS